MTTIVGIGTGDETQDATLIVAAPRTKSLVGELLALSFSGELVREAACPVMLV
jgi:hypothetical protein